MATQLARTPLSKRAQPFIPGPNRSASLVTPQPVAWIPVFAAAARMACGDDLPQKANSSAEVESVSLKRGRTATTTPKRLASRTPSPSGFSECLSEASTFAESWSNQESVSDLGTVPDQIDYADSLQEKSELAIKNTFVHLLKGSVVDSESSLKGMKKSPSAPSILMTCDYKHLTMAELHAQGRCTPCGYLHTKADGCRLGSQCKCCHFCPADELKKRKKQKLKSIKARKAAMKAMEEAEAADVVG